MGTPPIIKKVSFGHCPNYLPPHPPLPNSGKLSNFFWTSKSDVLASITESSNDDYDNDIDGSDNCDFNFGTFQSNF